MWKTIHMNWKLNLKERILLVLIIIVSIVISYKILKHPENQIWSDMEGYYVYLPSVFIYNDFVKEAVRDTNYIKPHPISGKTYTKYTCGVALMEMPFFLATHAYAKWTNDDTSGKSAIYGRGLAWAGLFYMWMGVFVLYRFSKKYFSKVNVIIALIGIVLGTNLFYYTFFQPAMSHVYSFFLFGLMLLISHHLFIERKTSAIKHVYLWMLFGLTFGMIVLVRPTNIVVGIIPLYFWMKNTTDKKAWLSGNFKYLVLCILIATLPMIPQLMYWKYISGHYITWSYGHESFEFWKEPKLFRVLFDAWNGWILYSPIVILPLIFLWIGRHDNKYHERGYIYVFILATYLFASWWAWWFGGAFGHRSYVEYLALLVMPFAGLLQHAQHSKFIYSGLLTLVILMIYYNLGLTFAYNAPWDGESWTYQSVWLEIKKIFYIQ